MASRDLDSRIDRLSSELEELKAKQKARDLNKSDKRFKALKDAHRAIIRVARMCKGTPPELNEALAWLDAEAAQAVSADDKTPSMFDEKKEDVA